MTIYMTRLLVVLALALGLSVPAMADGGKGANKLEGAWVARVQEAPGQWSYVISSDPSGRHASGHGSVDVGFSANVICAMFNQPVEFDPTDSTSPILVNIVMNGPDTASYYSVWYGLKDLVPDEYNPMTADIVFIGVVTGNLEFVGPGKIEGTHDFAIYDPDADTDGDGFPNEGMDPECIFTLTTVDTRLPMPD